MNSSLLWKTSKQRVLSDLWLVPHYSHRGVPMNISKSSWLSWDVATTIYNFTALRIAWFLRGKVLFFPIHKTLRESYTICAKKKKQTLGRSPVCFQMEHKYFAGLLQFKIKAPVAYYHKNSELFLFIYWPGISLGKQLLSCSDKTQASCSKLFHMFLYLAQTGLLICPNIIEFALDKQKKYVRNLWTRRKQNRWFLRRMSYHWKPQISIKGIKKSIFRQIFKSMQIMYTSLNNYLKLNKIC